VVMTDDLEMGAIAGHTQVSEAARQALSAGADLLLICESVAAVRQTIARLAEDEKLRRRGQEAAARLAHLMKGLRPATVTLAEVQRYFGLG
jgi:beta-glucosidase-like glycosyl hydrolase